MGETVDLNKIAADIEEIIRREITNLLTMTELNVSQAKQLEMYSKILSQATERRKLVGKHDWTSDKKAEELEDLFEEDDE